MVFHCNEIHLSNVGILYSRNFYIDRVAAFHFKFGRTRGKSNLGFDFCSLWLRFDFSIEAVWTKKCSTGDPNFDTVAFWHKIQTFHAFEKNWIKVSYKWSWIFNWKTTYIKSRRSRKIPNPGDYWIFHSFPENQRDFPEILMNREPRTLKILNWDRDFRELPYWSKFV